MFWMWIYASSTELDKEYEVIDDVSGINVTGQEK